MSARTAHVVRLTVYAVVIGLLAVVVAAVASGRYQVRPILSGSMEPGLPTGGVVITQRVPISEIKVRDVVVFHRPDRPDDVITHRITELTESANGPVIQTQGDANVIPDPWKVTMRGDTAYRAVFTRPVVGYAAGWVQGPTGRLALTVLGLLLVLGAAVAGLVRRSRPVAPGANIDGLQAAESPRPDSEKVPHLHTRPADADRALSSPGA